jgi:hypothetical protein
MRLNSDASVYGGTTATGLRLLGDACFVSGDKWSAASACPCGEVREAATVAAMAARAASWLAETTTAGSSIAAIADSIWFNRTLNLVRWQAGDERGRLLFWGHQQPHL